MNIGTLEVQLTAGIARLQSDMNQARASVNSATAQIERAASAARAALASIGLGVGLSQIIQLSDEYAKFTAQLRLATQSQLEYARAYADVRRIANDSQQALGATGILYARIANGTRELGTTQKQVAAITETVNMALKVSGATATESASAQLQLSQAFASGTLRGEEFNAVNEAAPRLMLALSEGIGVPVGALKKMAEEGRITSKIMADVLPNALMNLREEAKQVQTIAGAFTVLKNNVMEFVGIQAQANGVVATLIGGIELLGSNLTLLVGVLGTVAATKIGLWLHALTKDTYEKIASNRAHVASTLAVAQAESTRIETTIASATAGRAELGVTQQRATAQLVAANATIASSRAAIAAAEAAGAQSFALRTLRVATADLAVAETMRAALLAESAALDRAKIAASAQLTAATAAQAAATAGLAAAQGAASVSGGLVRGAIAMLGGPVGAIITLLGLGATAWAVWGQSARDGSKTASDAVRQSTEEILADGDRQIEKINQRNELARRGIPATKADSAQVVRLAEVVSNMDKAARGEGQYVNLNLEARQTILMSLGREYGQLTTQIDRINKADAETRANSQRKSYGDWMKDYATKSEQLTEKLKQARTELGAAFTPELEQRIRKQFEVKDVGAHKELEAYASLKVAVGEKIAEASREAAGLKSLTEAQKLQVALDEQTATGKLKLTGAHKAAYEQQIKDLAVHLEVVASQKRAAAGSEAINKLMKETAEASKKSIEDGVKEAEKNEELVRTFGMTKGALEALELARLEEQLAQRSSLGLTLVEIETLDKLIEAKKRSASAMATIDALESQKKLWESIEKTAHDTFISIFTSGKSAFDRLRDTLKNGLYELLYQMTLKKWLVSIGASITGSGAGGVGGAVGAATGLGNIANAASGAYGLFQAGGALAGGSLSSIASGSTYATGLLSQQSLMLAAQEATGATASLLGGAADVAGMFAAIPGWGWAALGAAAIGAYLLSGDGPESNTRLNFGSNNAAGAISINERGNEGRASSYIDGSATSAFGTFGVVSSFWMNAAQPAVQDFIRTVAKTDDALASFLTATERASVSSYLTGRVSIANTGAEGANPNATGQLDKVFAERINNILEGVEPGLASLTAGFAGTSQQLATETAAILQYRQALVDSGEAVFGARVTLQEVAALKLPTENTSDALTRIAAVFAATNQAAKLMGQTTQEAFGAVGMASYEARQRMVELAGGLQGLAAILNELQQAQQNYASAVSAAQSAIRAAADQYQEFVRAVTVAEGEVARSRASIFSEYSSALASEMDAKRAVADEQARITEGYVAASQKVAEAQRKVVDSFGRVGASLQEFLSSMDTSDIAGATPRDQLAASQTRLAILAAQAKAGDLNAFDKIPAIASNILKLGQTNSATSIDFARIAASVRSTVADVSAYADSRVKAATPASDPNVVELDELASAIAEQKKWSNAIVTSGASFTTSTASILDGYNRAVAEQIKASSSVGYWASIAQSTGTSMTYAGDEMSKLGQELLTGFFTAKTALEQAQNDLGAANAIKGALELRQTSALENFVSAVINVNTTAQTVLDSAGALFKIASHELLVGTELSSKTMLEAKGGMEYWGSVVMTTAKGIAESVATLSQATASNAAIASANAAALKAAAAAAALGASTASGTGQVGASTALVESIYRSVLGREAEASGLAFWVRALTTGAMSATNAAVEIAKGAAAQSEHLDGPHASDWTRENALADDIRGTSYLRSLGIPGYASGGMFGGGLRLVGEYGPELEATGASRIWSSSQTRSMLGAGEDLQSLVDALKTELSSLRTEIGKVAKSAERSADYNKRHFDLTNKVTNGGEAMLTEPA